ncbi:TIGR02678 family protein [Tomitella biformata]|uniref:TIGR02678 family protein n=1 Tax=Tomitella biformata TaxID=630403 RepID=UPI0004672988|nr:TIGR02678 family protein [Tomitella biformata]
MSRPPSPGTSGALTNALAATRDAERMRAARALLLRPLLHAAGQDVSRRDLPGRDIPGRDIPDHDAETFAMVRRHAQYLRDWHRANTGWSLLVDTELARLVKTVESRQSVSGEHTHPAVDARSKTAFTRRRYVLFCLSLAALSRADTQITLGRLAEQVVLGAADPELAAAGIAFTLEHRDERSDLVAVVRRLIEYGALSRVAGEEDSFVDHTGDVLYDVQRRVLSALLATDRGPSTVAAADNGERLALLTAPPRAATDEHHERQLRRRLTRRLLDEPVLYYDELAADEREYLVRHRIAITRRIAEFTGLVAEARREGVAMVDPHDELTDVRMPETGTTGHATLLVADFLASSGSAVVPVDELREWLRAQALMFVSQHLWRKDSAEPAGQEELLGTVLDRLEALRLIVRESDLDAVRLRPAIARFALAEPTVTGLPDPQDPSVQDPSVHDPSVQDPSVGVSTS